MLMKLIAKIKNQKGFTLIELLVVIAIIGVLAAVAVPKFMDSTASARTAKVQADLGAMDTAIQTYMSNNGGAIPIADGSTIITYMSSGALPTSTAGSYRITGTTEAVTAVAYTVNQTTARAQVAFTGGAKAGPFDSLALKTN